MKTWLVRLLPRKAGAPASRSDAPKVAVRLQPTGGGSRQSCVASATVETVRAPKRGRQIGNGPPGVADATRLRWGVRGPWAEAARLPSCHRYAIAVGCFRPALALTLLLFGLAAGLLAQQPATEESRSRFRAVDIYVDAGTTPLAAYQLEFAATNGVARIVGIEGGEPSAFRQPPFYDPKALQHERVIIAGFSTAAATDLPTGKTRVATIHYQTADTQPPQFELKLQAAGDPQGTRISAQPSFTERKTP